jgi:group I intron endonuclease
VNIGIYSISHSSGDIYIGSSIELKKRLYYHKHRLRKGTHFNPKLQAAWDKYGEDAFTFSVVEYVLEKSQIIVREQYWIDANMGRLYNLCPVAGNTMGRTHTAATREKIRKANLGKKATDQAKSNMAASQRGRKHPEGIRAKISKAHKGRKFSESHRKALSEARKAPDLLAHSLANCKKMSGMLKGKKRAPFTAEHRDKLAAAARAQHERRRSSLLS